MIRAFSIQNFKSILEARIDFSYAEGKAPPASSTTEILPFLVDGKTKADRIVPVLAVYGANASGKSNIVQSFQMFQQLLRRGVSCGYFPNKLNRRFATTKFTVDVVLQDGAPCSYSISYNDRGISQEELVLPATSGDGSAQVVFRLESGASDAAESNVSALDFAGLATADYPAERLKEAVRVECSDAEGRQVRPFLWCLERSFAGLSPITASLGREVLQRLYVSPRNEFFVSQGIDLLAGEDSDLARQKAIDEIASLLRKFDFGIQNLSLLRQKLPTRTGEGCHVPEGSILCQRERDAVVDQITTRHVDAGGNPVTFNFMTEESDGTKVVAGLLGICLWAMKTGRTVVVDELDRSLHPFILVSLVKLFKSRRYNVANGRLVFTLHDPTLLDESMMRVSEVAIVNKTLKDGTTLRRLSDYDGVRNVVNFRRQYLGGAYSGIPFPYV